MSSDLLDAELSAIKQLKRRLVSAANHFAWRDGVQRRATRISALVRRLPALVHAERVARSRGPFGWIISAADADGGSRAVLEMVTRNHARSVQDLDRPFPLRVLHPRLVAMADLEQLASSGAVLLQIGEAA